MQNHSETRETHPYVYKGEHPILPPMKRDIGVGVKSCSVAHTPHTLHDKERRTPVNIRLQRSLHDRFMIYCGKEMTAGDFYEEAGILFMELNPKNGTVVIVEKNGRRRTSLNDTVQEIICMGELQEFIDDVESRTSDRPLHHNYVKRLGKILKRCDAIKSQSERLQETMKKAVGYVA